MLLRVVIAVKSEELDKKIRRHLSESDVTVESFWHLKNPFQKAIRTNGDVVIISSSLMPSPIESSIAMLNDLPENPTTIILHDSKSQEESANLVAQGADVVLYSSLPFKTMLEAIEKTIESRRQLAENPISGKWQATHPKIEEFVSNSAQMQIFMDLVMKITPSSAPVLVLGETGVGKEHLARLIHSTGPRSAGPFVAVNCTSLPEQLLESELFGHEEGAFTGAIRSRRGAFELAHGGTIFLDEIGDLPIHLQAKMLRVLQDFEVRPVGSEKSMWVDTRVIAASNRDIENEIKTGQFRKDLYYRLSVITLTVPPLRNRKEDIAALTDYYIDLLGDRMKKDITGISDEALEMLTEYEWPGNVRELINVLERAVILCHGDEIESADLPQVFAAGQDSELSPERFIENLETEWLDKPLHELKRLVMENLEHAYFERVLKTTHGRVGDAAKMAGIHPRGMYDKMKRYGLRKEEFKLNGD
jgi:DNA-binding NtrC family response regulator